MAFREEPSSNIIKAMEELTISTKEEGDTGKASGGEKGFPKFPSPPDPIPEPGSADLLMPQPRPRLPRYNPPPPEGTGSSYAEEQKLQDAAERGDIGEVARLNESGVSVNSNDQLCHLNQQNTKQLHDLKQKEQELQDLRQQKEQELHDLRQRKEQELHDLRQQKEQKEQELNDLRQQKERELHDLRQQKEQELHDLRQQKEQKEQEFHDLRQQKEQKEQELHDLRQQKEQELNDVRQQMESYKQQAQDAKKSAQLSQFSRQQAEAQLAHHTKLTVQDTAQKNDLKRHWIVQSDEIKDVHEEKPLRVGGWGEVSVAMFRGMKVAANKATISPDKTDLFIREMTTQACVRHPNLLLFIGASQEENKFVIITELMQANLQGIIPTLSQAQDHVITIGTDVACALNYLHLMKPHPIIHRNVSSENVLLEQIGSGNWKAKVSGYGSANFVSMVTTTEPRNASYAAPETSDPEVQSPKMDVYSYGILLLEMATGQSPDPKLKATRLETLLWQNMAALIRKCICEDPASRIDMKGALVLMPQLKK